MKKLRLLFIFFIVIFITLFPTSSGVAFADVGTVQGSDVLTDLSGDTSFSAQNYPIDNSNYSLSVITVAESVNNELLLYVYQPCVSMDFRANYISISTTVNDSIRFEIKSLTFCNKSGTLYKYVVDGVTVNTANEVRYYEIASIFRPFNETIDTQAQFDNTVNAVVFGVSKCWKIGEINGNSYVECSNIATVEISDKFVGFCRYSNGSNFFHSGESTDAHFVAFSTNYDISNLYEADVWYCTKSYKEDTTENNGQTDSDIVWGDEVSHTKTCYSDEYVQREQGYWLADDYDFYRIVSTADFIQAEVGERSNVWGLSYNGVFVNIDTTQTNELTTTTLSALQNTQWVLRFAETDYWDYSTSHPGVDRIYKEESTRVTKVTILRLKFKSNGVVYNLGCVDNMQTGGSAPANKITQDLNVELSDEFKEFLLILCIIIGVLILCIFLPYVLKFVGFIFKIVFAPIKWLFGSKSRRKRR
jgi:hypothetical protein